VNEQRKQKQTETAWFMPLTGKVNTVLKKAHRKQLMKHTLRGKNTTSPNGYHPGESSQRMCIFELCGSHKWTCERFCSFLLCFPQANRTPRLAAMLGCFPDIFWLPSPHHHKYVTFLAAVLLKPIGFQRFAANRSCLC
jgi:hypothetical protein